MGTVITTSIYQGITLGVGGSYQSPLTIAAGAKVTPNYANPGKGAIAVYGSAAVDDLTLINDGYIAGGGGRSGTGAGVELLGVSSFANTGIVLGGSGGGSVAGVGVDLSGAGDFSNSGTITGGYGAEGGAAVMLAGAGSFNNVGSILGGTGSGHGGTGISLTGAGTFDNYGTIRGGTGDGDQGGIGAYLTGTSILLTNTGLITGGYGQFIGGSGVYLGGSGTFNNGGTIIAANGNGTRGGYGVAVNGRVTLINSGTIEGGDRIGVGSGAGGGVGVDFEGTMLIDSGLIAGGTATGNTQANALDFVGTTVGTLVVESGAVFTGDVVANATLADVLALGGGAAVTLSGLGTQFTNFHTLAFEPGAVGTVSGTYTGFSNLAIDGFAVGDTLVLDGFDATLHSYVSGAGLELSNGTSTITLDITGNFSTANFTVADTPASTTISLNAACFAAGTRILTRRGEIPVEALQVGDALVLHGGGTAPIRWIGHRELALSKHPRPERVNPVRIAAGAVMDGVPQRDLVLSPDHAVYLEGMLIPVKALVNGSTIRQEVRRRVRYYHVELERDEF